MREKYNIRLKTNTNKDDDGTFLEFTVLANHGANLIEIAEDIGKELIGFEIYKIISIRKVGNDNE